MDRAGLFELAKPRYPLLDELNSMPYELQSKLLRVLQESQHPGGLGLRGFPVDVRVITTQNEDPVDLVIRQENSVRTYTTASAWSP